MPRFQSILLWYLSLFILFGRFQFGIWFTLKSKSWGQASSFVLPHFCVFMGSPIRWKLRNIFNFLYSILLMNTLVLVSYQFTTDFKCSDAFTDKHYAFLTTINTINYLAGVMNQLDVWSDLMSWTFEAYWYSDLLCGIFLLKFCEILCYYWVQFEHCICGVYFSISLRF